MEDRSFTEVDLRLMLDAARSIRQDVVEGRFVVDTSHTGWDIIRERGGRPPRVAPVVTTMVWFAV